MENEKDLENTKEKNEPEMTMNTEPSAEPSTSWSAWGSWAASAVTAAAETVTKQANDIADKSLNVLSEASEYMQKDLEEFTKVVKEDTAAAYSTVAQKTFESINQYAGEQVANEAVGIKEAASSMLGSGLRNLVDGVEKILLDDESDDDDHQCPKASPIENEVEYEIHPQTYLTDPTDPTYAAWKNQFLATIEQRKNKLTDILIARTNVRLMYNKLVPKKVNHNEFWARYLFTLEQADCVPETKHVEAIDIETISDTSSPPDGDQIQSENPAEPLKDSSGPSDMEIISASDAKEQKKAKSCDNSCASSNIDDWEKDLDIDGLDITEEEMAKALEEVDEDWDLED